MTTDLSNGAVTKGERIASSTTGSPDGVAETLPQLPKRSVQESLGLPPGTGLFIPFTVATVGIMLLLIVLTVIPYVTDSGRTTPENPPTPVANEKQEQPAPAPAATTPATTNVAIPDPSSKVNPKITVKSDFPDKLGESGTKTAKPNVNPLDKKDDDLLKEIK
jgi:hypothetical protein